MNNFECEQFLELTLSLGRQYVETGAKRLKEWKIRFIEFTMHTALKI